MKILFDSGSHRSYISEDLSKKLCLQEESETDIHLLTFGANRAQKVTTEYAQFKLKLKSGKKMTI